jgi:hypothetical protein
MLCGSKEQLRLHPTHISLDYLKIALRIHIPFENNSNEQPN